FARFRVDGNGKRRADRFAELAGDATLLAVRIAAQRVQAAETRRLRRLLVRVLDRDLTREQVPPGQAQALDELPEQQALEITFQSVHVSTPEKLSTRRRGRRIR